MGETARPAEATALRRALHANPELSGAEEHTAATVARFLDERTSARAIARGLGGHGVLAVYGDGPVRTLLRAELDALPIAEATGLPHASASPGCMHACGHDGHMAILCDVARRLSADPPPNAVALLFQPAEETGAGAAAVLASDALPDLSTARAFALHNLPGRPLGEVSVRRGAMLCASTGLAITLIGRPSHAAEPERALSPAAAVAALIAGLPSSRASPLVMTTLTHARLGEPTFGVAAGHATIHATCRAEGDGLLAAEVDRVRALCADAAAGLALAITPREPFAATVNTTDGFDAVAAAAEDAGLPLRVLDAPMRWSEDFGLLINACGGGGAMAMLGAGERCPPLHDPSYDFPDAMIDAGAALLERLARR